MVDREYEIAGALGGRPVQRKTGCRSKYHSSSCQSKAIWSRSFCADCEILEFNWDRASWPRLSVLQRHLSNELCDLIKLHINTKLYWKLTSFLFGGVTDDQVGYLPLQYSKTNISPRALVPILGCQGAKRSGFAAVKGISSIEAKDKTALYQTDGLWRRILSSGRATFLASCCIKLAPLFSAYLCSYYQCRTLRGVCTEARCAI